MLFWCTLLFVAFAAKNDKRCPKLRNVSARQVINKLNFKPCNLPADIRCGYDFECCCGECFDAIKASCWEGQWSIVFTDMCTMSDYWCDMAPFPRDGYLIEWNRICPRTGRIMKKNGKHVLKFNDFDKAKAACNNNAACTGVVDFQCNINHFALCNVDESQWVKDRKTCTHVRVE